MAHHSQTIAVDFDDTLAITLNRDWVNAEPNIKLIERLNALYDEGWDIHVVTARGQLSCEGDSNAADRKYRDQIETWLQAHGVKYTSLSFQKKLAAFYIDDKGITPDLFLATFGRTNLKGGMSGATVFYDKTANAVFKTAKNTHTAVAWYAFAKEHYNVPVIYSVIGETIKMQKLDEYKGPFERILNVCYDFRQFPPLHPGLLPYRYVDRCLHRIRTELGDTALDWKFLDSILDYASHVVPVTFSHGDFSHSNIMSHDMVQGQGVYLIDPINDPTLLSSWIIDLAKLYMSIELDFINEIDDRLKQIEIFANDKKVPLDVLHAHVIGHYCRVFPYADQDKKDLILNIIKMRIEDFKTRAKLYAYAKEIKMPEYVL